MIEYPYNEDIISSTWALLLIIHSRELSRFKLRIILLNALCYKMSAIHIDMECKGKFNKKSLNLQEFGLKNVHSSITKHKIGVHY